MNFFGWHTLSENPRFATDHDRSVDNIEKYKVAKKTAKRAVSEVNGYVSTRFSGPGSTSDRGKNFHAITFFCVCAIVWD